MAEIDKIICKYQLFDREQRVYVIKDGNLIQKHSVLTTNLGEFITEQCYKYNIYRVQLYGNSKTLFLVSAKIAEQEKYNYNLNKIEIEIFEEG